MTSFDLSPLEPDDSVYKHNEQYYGWSVQENLPCDRDECTWMKKAVEVLETNEYYNRYNNACRGGMVEVINEFLTLEGTHLIASS